MLKSTRKKNLLIISGLPDDIVINDILTRLPVKTLMRFKLVSKQWYSTIQEDPNFSELHLSRSTPSSTKFLISFLCKEIDDTHTDYSNIHLQHTVAVDHTGKSASFVGLPLLKLKSFVDGLVAYYTCFAGGTVYVCNLSTKQTITLPPYDRPGEQIFDLGGACHKVVEYFEIGYDRVTKMYKVLHICHVDFIWDSDDDFTVEQLLKCYLVISIITIGKDDCWRKMSDRPPYPLNHLYKAYSNGAIHWIPDLVDDLPDKLVIVAFDFTTEKFRVIPLPGYITGDNYMTVYTLRFLGAMAGGHLALYDAKHREKNTVLIWLMEDYVNQVWTNKTFEYPFECDFFDPIGTLPSGEIIMKPTRDTRKCWLYYYDLAKNTSRRVEFTSLPSQEYCRGDRSGRRVNIYHFVENLYSWKI